MKDKGNSEMKIAVIVPAFNEARRIQETLAAVQSALTELGDMGSDAHIYVIDDGSTDDTAHLAEEAGADRIIRHKLNRGLGAAVRTGLMAARRNDVDIVVKFDADLQHDPRDIPALIRPIVDDEADVVYGARFNRIEYRMPVVRRAGNWTFTRIMRFLTGWPVEDSQPGIFAVGRAYLEVFRIPGDYNYTQQILLDAYHKGMRFAHRDVHFRQRTTGRSFVSLKYPFKVIPQLFWVLVGLRPMKVFGPAGAAFLVVASLVGVIELLMWAFGNADKPIVHVNAVLGFGIFGLNTLMFGVIAELIIQSGRK